MRNALSKPQFYGVRRPRPYPKRLPERKALTLIMGWRASDGIVVFADAQETAGDYRVAVQKITPQETTQFEVIAVGTGPADLVESFKIVLARKLKRKHFARLDRFVDMTEETLVEFYANDVRVHPAQDKYVKFLIAAFSKRSGAYEAWITENARLHRIEEFEILGWDEALYKTVASRVYQSCLNTAYALVCGTYLFGLAKDTSNYVGGATSAALIGSNGIQMTDANVMKAHETNVRNHQKEVDQSLVSSLLKVMKDKQ